MISVSKLTKVYGLTTAVDQVSFEVPEGQIVGFLGPNGAGKSTTIRMLTCYLAPTSGGATVAGLDIFHQSEEVRQKLGYLPESCPLYMEMKVEEYLDFRGRLRKLDRETRRKRIDYVLERCWLTTVRRKTISHLSKGYRQRVGLADALLHNPPVLILDEPTVGLDPAQIRETRKLIKDLARNHTVMLSTHILPEVEAVCDRVIVISAGKIVAQGTVEELRHNQRMQGGVRVECKAQAEALKAALGRISGVTGVQVTDDASGYVVARVKARDGYDVREELARTLAQHNWPMRELRTEQATLEEFFVQVTAGQLGQGAAL